MAGYSSVCSVLGFDAEMFVHVSLNSSSTTHSWSTESVGFRIDTVKEAFKPTSFETPIPCVAEAWRAQTQPSYTWIVPTQITSLSSHTIKPVNMEAVLLVLMGVQLCVADISFPRGALQVDHSVFLPAQGVEAVKSPERPSEISLPSNASNHSSSNIVDRSAGLLFSEKLSLFTDVLTYDPWSYFEFINFDTGPFQPNDERNMIINSFLAIQLALFHSIEVLAGEMQKPLPDNPSFLRYFNPEDLETVYQRLVLILAGIGGQAPYLDQLRTCSIYGPQYRKIELAYATTPAIRIQIATSPIRISLPMSIPTSTRWVYECPTSLFVLSSSTNRSYLCTSFLGDFGRPSRRDVT